MPDKISVTRVGSIAFSVASGVLGESIFPFRALDLRF
jgi:hypothetical protein